MRTAWRRPQRRLLPAGDTFAAAGLTGARWQVLGSIALARRWDRWPWSPDGWASPAGACTASSTSFPLPVICNSLNPHHKRAKLVALTEVGRYGVAQALQTPLGNALARAFDFGALAVARDVLRVLRTRLGSDGEE